MFTLKKILEAFVLPPGSAVVLLLALAYWLRRRTRAGALACLAVACLIWAGTTDVFSDAVMRPLENAYQAPAKPQGDVIVMLCAGFRGAGNPYSASERLSTGTLERAAVAYKLQKDTGLPLLISGGAPFSAQPESEAAAAYLTELGVKPEKIVTEADSRDTEENARYTIKLCREKGYKKIILLTSAYHLPRAVFLFRALGAQELTPFPAARRTGGRRYFRDFLPGGSLEARLALNEYLGLAWYRLRYLFS
jgi:uncharacterized SAM-binding protein YcdF (DUF218 family)